MLKGSQGGSFVLIRSAPYPLCRLVNKGGGHLGGDFECIE